MVLLSLVSPPNHTPPKSPSSVVVGEMLISRCVNVVAELEWVGEGVSRLKDNLNEPPVSTSEHKSHGIHTQQVAIAVKTQHNTKQL